MFLEDFGLAPLLWLPSGKPASQLNPRYAAPEVHEPVSSPAADQYSLALIYTEMLTGIYPRTKALSGKSGMHPSAHNPGRRVGTAPPRQTLPPNRPAPLCQALLARGGRERVGGQGGPRLPTP